MTPTRQQGTWWVGAFWLTVLGAELAGAVWLLSRWRG